jgi:hypothetical protein
MTDHDDLSGPLTQEEIDRYGPIACYSCGEEITAPGEWVQMRPSTAYPFCAACLTPEEER